MPTGSEPFERSPKIFHSYPQNYIHRFSQKSDTGLPLELLQEYIFLPLDIYCKIYHNKGIQSKREAWLAFFILDEPEAVIDILTSYPEFKPMYEQIYEICRNMEKVMGIFSKELLEMDRSYSRHTLWGRMEFLLSHPFGDGCVYSSSLS